jgi:hypothetical protein
MVGPQTIVGMKKDLATIALAAIDWRHKYPGADCGRCPL